MKIKTLNPLEHEFINAKTILLKITPETNIIRDKNNSIVKLETNVGVTIEIGDEIKHNFDTLLSEFIVKEIVESEKFKYYYKLNSGIINKTYKYLLPSLFLADKFTYNTMMINFYFLECYVSMFTNELVLCYRYSKLNLYTKLQELLISHPKFTRLIHNNGYDYYCFDVNKKDLNYFIQGKYSKLSQELKNNIKKFFKLKKNDVILQVIFKDKELKKQLELMYDIKLDDNLELDSKPDDKDLIDLTNFKMHI